MPFQEEWVTEDMLNDDEERGTLAVDEDDGNGSADGTRISQVLQEYESLEEFKATVQSCENWDQIITLVRLYEF